MKTILTAIGIAFGFSAMPAESTTPAVSWYTPPTPGTDPSFDAATYEKLKILRGSFNWDRAPLETALRDCTSESKKSDPSHLGIRFVLAAPSSKKVSITLENEVFLNVLGYMWIQANFDIKIHKNEVLIVPRTSG